jgi:hypothetical protein
VAGFEMIEPFEYKANYQVLGLILPTKKERKFSVFCQNFLFSVNSNRNLKLPVEKCTEKNYRILTS